MMSAAQWTRGSLAEQGKSVLPNGHVGHWPSEGYVLSNRIRRGRLVEWSDELERA